MEGRWRWDRHIAVAADMAAALASARVAAGTAAVAGTAVVLLAAVGLAGRAVGMPAAVALEAVPIVPYRQRRPQSDSV